MKDIESLKKIAVLIDADNTQRGKLGAILEEVSKHGHIVIKRAYGDWSSENLKYWKKELNELAVQAVQQFAYTTGKNSTDAAMLIDAMDLLYTKKFEAFVLVSSDSDFTKLASRLRESEVFVFGVGEKKTPIAFRNVCDNFIFIENLTNIEEETEETSHAEELEVKVNKRRPNYQKSKKKTSELIHLLQKSLESASDEDGWIHVSAAGDYIRRVKPDFDTRTYGFKKLTDVIASLGDTFELRKNKTNGNSAVYIYRLKK